MLRIFLLSSFCQYFVAKKKFFYVFIKRNLFCICFNRFWHSTTSYAIAKETAFDCYLPPQGHSVYSWPTDLIRPSAVVFLTTPEKDRDFRVNERQEITNEEQLISQNILLRERFFFINFYNKETG